DDNPKNNSYFFELLSNLAVEIDLALTTAEGLERLSRKHYDLILSDMGRSEGGKFEATAGLSLLAQVRTSDKNVPFVFVTTSRAVVEYRAQAEQLNARITNSATEL